MAAGGECLVAVSAALAAQLACGRSEAQLTVLAAFLTSLADNLALIAAQRAIAPPACGNTPKNNSKNTIASGSEIA